MANLRFLKKRLKNMFTGGGVTMVEKCGGCGLQGSGGVAGVVGGSCHEHVTVTAPFGFSIGHPKNPAF